MKGLLGPWEKSYEATKLHFILGVIESIAAIS